MAAARSPIDEASSPYYLHPSDGPNLILVSQALTEDNYASWSRAMIISLTVKNKVSFVTGTIVDPGIQDPILQNAWIRNNSMVMSWIINAVSKDIQGSIMYSLSAKDIWDDLKVRFSQTNGPRIFQLRRELANLSQGSQSVNVYFTKVKAIWDELANYRPSCTCNKCTCGGLTGLSAHYNQEYVMSFLMGLNEHLSQTRGQILLMDPLPSISKVFAFVSQEERQRSVSAISHEPLAASFAATAAFRRPTNNQFYNPNFKKKDRPFCTHCHLNGHTVEKCYKLHGYPPRFKPRPRAPPPQGSNINQVSSQQAPLPMASAENPLHPTPIEGFLQNMTPTQCQHLMSMLSSTVVASGQNIGTVSCVSGIFSSLFTNQSPILPHHWIMDSGASRHICNDKSAFFNLKYVDNASVILPDATMFHVPCIGDVQLNSTITLTNVFYVPQFTFNLISVSALLMNNSYTLSFNMHSFLLQDKACRMIGKGNKIEGLYVLDQSHIGFCNKISTVIWHKRLGHMPFKTLKSHKGTHCC
ncbi:hypothetical protein ABFS82_11G102700 [Erythranthe guttata]